MNTYRGTWYDLNEIILVEPDLVSAESETEATSQFYIKYGGRNTPGPCLLVEKVK